MANGRISTELTNDASQFNQSMNEATGKVEKFSDKVDDAKGSINDLGKKGAQSTRDLLKEIGKMTGAEKGLSGYRRQLSQMTKDIQDLTVNFRNMTKEQQNSQIGQATLRRIQELTVKASEYKDAIMDSQNAVKNLASDTAIWDGVAQGIDAASSALQSFAAAGILSEQSQEGLLRIITQMKGAQAACNTVIKVGNLLQRDSKVITAITTLQTKALAKAKDLETVATGKATVAQKIFNAVAKSNPYILLAAAILAVVTAIGAWTLATKKHNSETERAKRIQEGYNKALKDGQKNAFDSIAKFQLLRAEYASLRTEGEKTQWIKDNKDRFNELGVELNNIADAQKWLVNNADKFIEALTLEAEAAALMEYYQDEYKKSIEESIKAKDKASKASPQGPTAEQRKSGKFKPGEDYIAHTITMPSTVGAVSSTVYEWTPEGKAKLDKFGEEAAEIVNNSTEENLKPIAELAAKKKLKAAGLKTASTPTPTSDNNSGGSGGKGGSGETPEERHLKEQEKLLKELHEAQLKLMALKTQSLSIDKNDTEAVKKQEDAIKGQEDAIENMKSKIDDKSKIINSELKLLKDYRDELNGQFDNIVDQSEEWKKQTNLINEVEKKIKDLEEASAAYKKRINTPPLELPKIEANPALQGKVTMQVNPEIKWDKMVDEYKKAGERLSKIQDWLDVGAISRQEAERLVAEINTDLKKVGVTVPVKLEVDKESVKTIQEQLAESLDQISGWGNVANNVVGSFNSIYESIKGLNDALDEAKNPWESFFALFQVGMTIFNGFTTIAESIGTVMKLLNITTAAGIPVKKAETEATRENTKENITNAASKGVSAAAGAGEAVSSIPYIGPILAAAAIATILATIFSAIASAKGYATGGVVGGNSYSGDKILARLNSGELVLNKNQQNELLYQLNNPGVSQNSSTMPLSNVRFILHGRDLIGVVENTNKINSKI